ncbi:MAG: hypothetical protein AABX17_04365 [Nanoarchaeota archaeon]
MNREIAYFLAETIIGQYAKMPLAISRVNLDINQLAEILGSALIWEHKEKMQFEIPGEEKDAPTQSSARGYTMQTFWPRRIFCNKDKPFRPPLGKIVMAYQRREEQQFYERRSSGLNPEVVCRDFRYNPKIKEIKHRLVAEGHEYGVMVDLYTLLGRDEVRVHIPLFFDPGATESDLDEFARFSVRQQNPLQEEISYANQRVFQEKFYPTK